jgi:hypothetical protein
LGPWPPSTGRDARRRVRRQAANPAAASSPASSAAIHHQAPSKLPLHPSRTAPHRSACASAPTPTPPDSASCLSSTAQAAPPLPWAWLACVGSPAAARPLWLTARRHALQRRGRGLQRRCLPRSRKPLHLGQHGHRAVHRPLRRRLRVVRLPPMPRRASCPRL